MTERADGPGDERGRQEASPPEHRPTAAGEPPPERDESLWLLAAAPLVWGVHFLLAYGTAAVWCAKAAGPGAPLGPIRTVIAGLSALALGAVAWIGWRSWQRHTLGRATLPHDEDTPEDRHRFLGFAAVLLSGLGGVAILYETLAALFVETCW